MALEDPFIGRGWAFPPAFDRATASVVMAEGAAEIEQSLAILFTTALGERIMRPDFGAAMANQVAEPMTTSRLTWLEEMVRTAILLNEPRIDADAVRVLHLPLEGRLEFHIGYRVGGANSRFNMVYPWYLTDGGPQGGGADGV
jgi:phage baseplate assembly protein W